MSAAWKYFRRLNAELTLLIFSARKERYQNRAIAQFMPFAWVWMLIPIAGVVGFYISLDEARKAHESFFRSK